MERNHNNRRKIAVGFTLVFVVIVVLVLAAFNKNTVPGDALNDGFFAQTEAYIAAAQGTALDVVLTYFDVSSQGLERPVACELRGCGEAVSADIVSLAEYNSDADFPSYSLDIRFNFNESGIYRTNEMVFIYPEDSSTHIIGDWFFDVSSEAEVLEIDSYSTVFATSEIDSLPYKYSFEDNALDDSKVYLQYNSVSRPAMLSHVSGEVFGEIQLPESRYPLRLIRPRIIVERGEKKLYAYPVAACQCGYLSFDEEAFNASRLIALGK